MAATAKFGKPFVAPMSTDHDGFWKVDDTAAYQMVPANGTRECALAMSGGRVRLSSAHPNVVVLADAVTGQPAANNLMTFDSQPFTAFAFKLQARSVGRTMILAEDARGRHLARLIVSVKAEQTKTYNPLILQDIRRRSKRQFEDVARIMREVEKVYLKQANIRLKTKRLPNVIFLKQDIGDPIDFSKKAVHDDINKALDEIKANSLDFNIVSCWNLVDGHQDAVGIDPAFGKTCFAEDYPDSTPLLTEVSTYAHELGHAFGCVHDGRPSNVMMSGDGSDGLQMTKDDIDMINKTGLSMP